MKTLSELFRLHFGFAPADVIPLAGAGSNRRYFRLQTEGISAVGVVGTSFEENKAFIYLSRHFGEKHLPVPEIYGVSNDGMCYLQQDLGTRSLYDAMSQAREQGYRYGHHEEELMERTLRTLARLQTEGAEGLDEQALLSPRHMNTQAAMFDLNYFKYMFLRVQDVPLNEVKLEDDMLRLANNLCGKPFKTFMYRDFQARNVMIGENNAPYFIDYQGGRLGPLQYDLASFLWQASARYPDDLRQRLVTAYLDELSTMRDVDEETFLKELQTFVLLRTLQVLGAYGLRGIVERKAYFLNSIPAALASVRNLLAAGVCSPYPYLEEILQQLCEANINYGKTE